MPGARRRPTRSTFPGRRRASRCRHSAIMPGLTGRPVLRRSRRRPGRTRSRSRKRRGRTRNSRNASRKPGPAVSRRPRLRGKIHSRSGKPNLRGSRKASLSGRRSPARHSRQPQAQARPQPMPPRPAPPPEPHPLDADFGEPVPLEPTTEPAKPKRRRPALLKWGLGALVISIVAFGLWMALTHAPGPAGITRRAKRRGRSRRSAEPQGRSLAQPSGRLATSSKPA